ncbi:MAG: SGNH/GDSL hydrolase family protein [Polyangiaceae bacterium]
MALQVGSRKGLLPLVRQNLTNHAPHIVLLMIGTNDVNSQLALSDAPARMAKLVDEFTTNAPSALLVVAKLIPTRTDTLNTDVRTFNAAVERIVSERVQSGKHILLVDMYGAFTANVNYKTAWLFDGLHPNDAGYEVMAKSWYAAIASSLR